MWPRDAKRLDNPDLKHSFSYDRSFFLKQNISLLIPFEIFFPFSVGDASTHNIVLITYLLFKKTSQQILEDSGIIFLLKEARLRQALF